MPAQLRTVLDLEYENHLSRVGNALALQLNSGFIRGREKRNPVLA